MKPLLWFVISFMGHQDHTLIDLMLRKFFFTTSNYILCLWSVKWTIRTLASFFPLTFSNFQISRTPIYDPHLRVVIPSTTHTMASWIDLPKFQNFIKLQFKSRCLSTTRRSKHEPYKTRTILSRLNFSITFQYIYIWYQICTNTFINLKKEAVHTYIFSIYALMYPVYT